MKKKTKAKSRNVLKNKSSRAVKAKKQKDPNVVDVREEVVWFNCPIRGRVCQKVKIKKYKTNILVEQRQVLDSKDIVDSIDTKDDGLSIYSGDDIGIVEEEK